MKIKHKGYCIFTIVTVVLTVVSLYGITRMNYYKSYVTAGHRRAFTELVSYVNDIETELTKATITSDKQIAASLAEKVWMYSAFAKENLGLLPVSVVQMDKTSDFLSQVGDYTYSISKKQSVTDDEIKQAVTLLDYSKTLSEELLAMEEGIMTGDVPVFAMNNTQTQFNSDLNEIEEKFDQYTSLIYDGPFSRHIENKDGELFDIEEIERYEAYEIAKEILAQKGGRIIFHGENEGSIPTYDYSTSIDKNREVYVKITKNGGFPLMLLDNKEINSININVSDASKKAKDFLINCGYVKMKQTGYIVEGNAVVFAYAYVQKDVIMYPDLIKVKVALDNGEIIGLEANGFLSNHIESRAIPEFKLTNNDVISQLNSNFRPEKINKTLIPLDTGKYVYCYEIKGSYNDKTFLLYKNSETGKEEDIKLFIKTEQGELTV